LSSQDYSEPVEKPRTPRSVNRGPLQLNLVGLQLSGAGTALTAALSVLFRLEHIKLMQTSTPMSMSNFGRVL